MVTHKLGIDRAIEKRGKIERKMMTLRKIIQRTKNPLKDEK